jgi:transcriptional repressor NrdR
MQCPFCPSQESKVIDSRQAKDGQEIRRRRECETCGRRFTTYEREEEALPMVIKKDGRREKFDRQKVLGGLLKACEKRPVSMAKLSELVNRVESKVSDSPDREISTIDIGEFLMESLQDLDKIAYVRFASVYRDFQDEQAFFNELKTLMRQKGVAQPVVQPAPDARDEQHRHAMEVVGQVRGGVTHLLLPLASRVALPILCAGHRPVLVEVPAVHVGNRPTQVLVLDDDPVPALTIRSGRCLHGDVEAFLDGRSIHRFVEVEAFADRARRHEQLVGGQIQLHGTQCVRTEAG